MSQIERKTILFNIQKDHIHICFKLCRIPGIYLEKTKLDSYKMKDIRLSDFACLYRQEHTDKMVISNTTFSRLIESAHKKIADALFHGKAIIMTT